MLRILPYLTVYCPNKDNNNGVIKMQIST